MNSPQAQIRTRRSSIVVRQSLRQSIIAPQGASALSLEEKAAQFDAHFPAPNKQWYTNKEDHPAGICGNHPEFERLAPC